MPVFAILLHSGGGTKSKDDRRVWRPVWDYDKQETRAPQPIVAALLACFDEQIDDLDPDDDFKTEQRAALIAECERFTQLLGG